MDDNPQEDGVNRLEIEDPVLLDTFRTDTKGRINFGERYAGKKVEVCVVSVEEDDES